MRTIKNEMILYALVSIAAPAFVIAMNVTFYAYKHFHFFPKLAVTLYIVAPIFVAILSFVKILMQGRMPLCFSRITNIAVLVLFVAGLFALYPPMKLLLTGEIALYPLWGLLSLLPQNLLAAFFFWLQLSAVAYDFFFRREQEGESQEIQIDGNTAKVQDTKDEKI
ncbi:MAG: hypothetical protein PHH48_08595 [Eubacteriales bacterium]|nr:hypothetical protein [Eubacteriales bacterium]